MYRCILKRIYLPFKSLGSQKPRSFEDVSGEFLKEFHLEILRSLGAPKHTLAIRVGVRGNNRFETITYSFMRTIYIQYKKTLRYVLTVVFKNIFLLFLCIIKFLSSLV